MPTLTLEIISIFVRKVKRRFLSPISSTWSEHAKFNDPPCVKKANKAVWTCVECCVRWKTASILCLGKNRSRSNSVSISGIYKCWRHGSSSCVTWIILSGKMKVLRGSSEHEIADFLFILLEKCCKISYFILSLSLAIGLVVVWMDAVGCLKSAKNIFFISR